MVENNLYKTYFFWILFIVLFSSGYVFFKSPFEFYFHYIFLFSLSPILVTKFGIPKFYFKIFIFLLLIGLFNIVFGNNLPFTFLKIFAGLSITIIFFYHVLEIYNFDCIKIFEIYCKATWILCLIAFIQIISFFIGFKDGFNFSWLLNKWGFVEGGLIGFRVNSILPEPTYLATSLSPAVYISIKNLISRKPYIFSKIQSILIIIISILTTSSIGYLGILLSLFLSINAIKLRYIFFGLIILLFGFKIAYKNVSDFTSRADSARGLWLENDFSINNTNNSSFVLFNNLHIAKENLKEHPLFGTGLGSHETAFKKHTLTKSLIQYDFEFNIKDGNSLFVRLCTETGFFGLGFIIIILVNGLIIKSENFTYDFFEHKMVSQALFILIVLVLIRQGNYMLNGLPLVFLLYYFNGKQYREKLSSIGK